MDTEEFKLDLIHALILQRIKQRMAAEGIAGISGVGPVIVNLDARTAICNVYLERTGEQLPDTESVYTGETTFDVKLRYPGEPLRSATRNAMLFASSRAGPGFPGKLRGGDACRNTAYRQFGTIAVTGNFRMEGTNYTDVALSCQHVLYHSTNRTIDTPRFGNCMELAWASQVPSQGKWTDVAVARIRNSSIHYPKRLRALGGIIGVRQPRAGIRVMKYGAGTGLTAGLDKGLVWRALDAQDPASLYLIRTVDGGSRFSFSGIGDSGAAVVDSDRNFLGIVLGGIPGLPQERWYLPVTPDGEQPIDQELSTFTLKLN